MKELDMVKQFLADNGIRDGEPMVKGVIGREPTAEEFIDYWSPKLAKLIKETLQECIGSDEKHYNGIKMVNEPDPDDYELYQRWTRNQLRQSALKKLEEKLTTDND